MHGISTVTDNQCSKILIHVKMEMKHTVPSFLEKIFIDIRILKLALKKLDFYTIRAIAANLNDESRAYGFSRVGEITMSLKEAAMSENSFGAAAIIEILLSYFAKLEVVYY